ncbi:PRTRC system protein C [Duganella sp. CT11-25]|uniref:PRTRC system protein C n=1 Tax=unclassified Duganella TaxID=2636909 RepID=UPI0039B00DCA
MKIQELQREFKYNGVKLADPSSTFSLTQVRDFFANVYPEIINADIDGPEVIGSKQIYSFRRAVGTKGHGAAFAHGIHIDPRLLEGRTTVTVQQVAMDILKLQAPSRKELAEISHQMAKLGWKRGRAFIAGVGLQNWCFSRELEPAGIPEQAAVVSLHQKISDLDALYQIGWFHTDRYDGHLIQQAVAAVQAGMKINLILHVDIDELHAIHCSRMHGDAA